MFDFIIDSIHTIIKNGFTLTSAGAILFLLLKQRKMKRRLKRYMPFLFADEEVNPTYVQNQSTIMENQRRIMEGLGLECVPTLEINSKDSVMRNAHLLPKHSTELSTVRYAEKYTHWRELKMKNYLKKLSRTKLQAYLLATIINILLLVGYMLDWQDVQSKLEEYTPLINMGLQVILTAVYTIVEGGIDKAKAQGGTSNEQADYTTESAE